MSGELKMQRLQGVIEDFSLEVGEFDPGFLRGEAIQRSASALLVMSGNSGLGATSHVLAQDAKRYRTGHFVRFTMDGKKIFGWLYRAPGFKDGDEVEAVASQNSDGTYSLYGLHRLSDHLVAVAPKCIRGFKAECRHSLVVWYGMSGFGVFIFTLIPVMAMMRGGVVKVLGLLYMLGGAAFCMGFMALFLLYPTFIKGRARDYSLFAEKIFAAFGWANPTEIDLDKETSAYIKTLDLAEEVYYSDTNANWTTMQGFCFRHIEPKRETESNAESPQAPSPADAQRDETTV